MGFRGIEPLPAVAVSFLALGAATAFTELLADRLRVLGPHHPDTLTTRADLAFWRGQVGDVAGAATAIAELLADFQRVLGPDHPATLSTRHNLAYVRRMWPGPPPPLPNCWPPP
ncbi:tetratricopeptide repeat protein [Streptomyces sp. NPDC055287]